MAEKKTTSKVKTAKPKPAAKKPRAVVSLVQRARATGRRGRGRR